MLVNRKYYSLILIMVILFVGGNPYPGLVGPKTH